METRKQDSQYVNVSTGKDPGLFCVRNGGIVANGETSCRHLGVKMSDIIIKRQFFAKIREIKSEFSENQVMKYGT